MNVIDVRVKHDMDIQNIKQQIFYNKLKVGK